MTERNHSELYDPEFTGYSESLDKIWYDDSLDYTSATSALAEELHTRKVKTDEAIAAGAIKRMVNILVDLRSIDEFQVSAAYVLGKIASEHTKEAVDHGAISALVALIKSSNDYARDQAVLALGSISAVSSDYRDRVIAAGALLPLVELSEKLLTMQGNATKTLSELCKGTQTKFDVIEPTVPVLHELIKPKDEATADNASRALNHLLEEDDVSIKSGLCPKLVQLVSHSSKSIAIEAVRIVGSIVEKDDSQIQAIIDARIIPHLVSHLVHSDNDIKNETARAISRATTRGSIQQIRYLVDEGCIQACCEMLSFPEAEAETVFYCLKSLHRILEVGETDGDDNPYAESIKECGGFDKIKILQLQDDAATTGNAQVREAALKKDDAATTGNAQVREAALKIVIDRFLAAAGGDQA